MILFVLIVAANIGLIVFISDIKSAQLTRKACFKIVN